MSEKRRVHSQMYWIPRQLTDDFQKQSDIRPDSKEWASQELHLFIVTDAGKPIFTRYGTIPMVSPIMCSYYAISSLMESLHEELDHFRAGSSTFVFLRKQSFIFIAVTKTGLPISHLFKQLHYLYLLFLSLFSEHILVQISQKPSLDFRLYAEPNRPTWNGVINNMSEDPAFIFSPSIPVTCANPKLRQIFSNSQSLFHLKSCKLSMLVKKNRVVAFGSHICDPISLRLIVDLVWTPVFQDEEHWVPLYLRNSNKTNFLFTHNFKGTDYYIVMLCGANQEMDTYHSVSVSLYNELMDANRNNELTITVKKASNVFYFWALNSLTHGQVYITDPDPKFFSDNNSSSELNNINRENSNKNQNLNDNDNGIYARNQNFNINTNENVNENQNINGNDAQNSNQITKDNGIQNQNLNENETSNENTNDGQSKIFDAKENHILNANENQTSNNDDIKSQNSNENENQNSSNNQNPNSEEEDYSNLTPAAFARKFSSSPNFFNSSSRDKMRELIRQLVKSYDYVKSNGNDGEYMFRGEKEIIVVYKSKEMELFAVARSEDLQDEDISKKLGELREYVNDHINELLVTDNKFTIEEFS